MSSPPAIDFPSDDIEMADESANGEQSMSNAPPIEPLFLAGTPQGTPMRTPTSGAVARSSSPLAYPSSSPAKAKTPRRRPNAMDSNQLLDSEPLDFQSYVHYLLIFAHYGDTDHHEGVLLLLSRHP